MLVEVGASETQRAAGAARLGFDKNVDGDVRGRFFAQRGQLALKGFGLESGEQEKARESVARGFLTQIADEGAARPRTTAV